MFYNFRRYYFVIFLCNLCHIFDASVINVATTIPSNVADILKKTNESEVVNFLNKTRRIINGIDSQANRPYMVYLQLPIKNPKYKDYRRWLCGGVIIHEEYILTSAACIEDAKNFYVVSGTFKHSINTNQGISPCIQNGAKKAIWKCVPRNYVFDGHENDNIRWMNNDIAVVKVEDEFDFERRVKGCDFIPKPICYNNQTAAFENPGNTGTIAGWGSTLKYNDWINSNRRQGPSETVLKETTVQIVNKNKCKRRWGSRYYNIIDNYMICTKDLVPDLSEICEEKYVDCTDVMYDEESGENQLRRVQAIDTRTGRKMSYSSGGFCENDHGGPLIAGDDMNHVVIGIISACLVKERTNRCYGPFLYTSVYKNRILLDCAIYKHKSQDCSKMYRASETHIETEISWIDHPDGPAKNEIAAIRRMEELKNSNASQVNVTDTVTYDTTDMTSVADEVNVTNEEHVTAKEYVATSDGVTNVDPMTTAEGPVLTKSPTNAAHAKSTHEAEVITGHKDKIEPHGGIVFRST